MLNDIKEQPEILNKLAKSYFSDVTSMTNLDLSLSNQEIKDINNIYIVASGSSRNVGNLSKYYFEKIFKVPVIVDYASEFAHRQPAIRKNDLVISISQSGETADTYAALKIAKQNNAYTLALTNNPESRIHKLADSSIKVRAGKELSIPATKSFTAQLFNIYALAIYMAEEKQTLPENKIQEFKKSLLTLPEKIDSIINNIDKLDIAAQKIKDVKNITIIGRSSCHAAVQEAALKIKETSYIDANGFPSGEFLHGYVAVLDENAPLISILLPEFDEPSTFNLAVRNTEEIKKKRNPDLIILKSESDKSIENNLLLKDSTFINIPDSREDIYSFLVVVCFQLLSYKIAQLLGRDINTPRGLSKSLQSE